MVKLLTDLERLILEFPEADWNWNQLSCNSSITWEFIRKHPTLPWKYNFVSANKNISWKIVKNNPYIRWHYGFMSNNTSVVTWEIVKNNPTLPWNKFWISANENITMQVILDNPGYDWSFSGLSSNPNITIEFVRSTIDKGWDFNSLCKNKAFTFDIINENRDLNWVHRSICENENITWDIIKKNVFPVSYFYFSKNKNLTLDILKEKTYEGFNLRELLRNPSFSIEQAKKIFKDHKSKLSRIQMDNLWEYIYQNPNLTYDDAKRLGIGTRERDFWSLSFNNFDSPRKRIENRAARVIQNGCLRWLIQDVTRDGKLGISLRLGLKELGSLSEAPLYFQGK